MDRPAMGDERCPISSPLMCLPIGLWLASLGADVMYRSGRAPASWDDAAFFSMFGGLAAALLLAGPGLVDELATGTRIRLTQWGLPGLQLAVVMLYVLNLSLRAYRPSAMLPVWLSFAGVALLVVTAGEILHARGERTVRRYAREVLIVTRRRRTARSA